VGLTDQIASLGERREKDLDLKTEKEWKEYKGMQELKKAEGLEGLDHIGEEIYLDYAKKSSLGMECFGCGGEDRIIVGGHIYSLSAFPSKDGKSEEVPTLYFCPRHLTDLAEQLLIHVFRVMKGKEEGAIKLPLRKWKGDDE
jgi:hypothetical protein